MDLSQKLMSLREYRHKSIAELSHVLGITADAYNRLETGDSEKLNETLADKLSDFYEIPASFFREDHENHRANITYCNCTFNAGSHGYINHQYNDAGVGHAFIKRDRDIVNLQQQMSTLIEKNDQLIQMLKAKSLTDSEQ
ncbi:MAG TPA: helix-turn-helix transcriptional regulator [Puia sp.]|nr:helix-turn-helix transcriptional regulator [Puia sp.]